MGNAGHRQVHANLGALAGEVHAQTFQNLLIHAGSNPDHMLGSPGEGALLLLLELGSGSLALGAEFGGGVPFVNITADGANKLSHVYTLLLFWKT